MGKTADNTVQKISLVKMSKSLLLAGLLGVAAQAPVPKGKLVAWAVMSVPDDDQATAAIMEIDQATGNSVFSAPFPVAAADQSALYCFIGFDNANSQGTYFVASGPGPNITTVDTSSGAVLGNVAMDPSAYVISFDYDTSKKSGVGLFASYTTGATFLAYVDPKDGSTQVINASLAGLKNTVIPCAQRLIPSAGLMVDISTDSDRDDSDETWRVIDYKNSSGAGVVWEGPWSFSKHGRVNAFVELPPTAGAVSLQGVLAVPKHDDDVWATFGFVNWTVAGDAAFTPLVDFASAFKANTSSLQLSDVTMTLGAMAVAEAVPGASYSVFMVCRDMGTEVPLLIQVDISVAGSSITLAAPPRLTLLNETGVGGDVYGLDWLPQA